MINLQLLFPKSQPAAAVASAIASSATALNVQPAPGNAAPTAPSDPFPRTSQPGADLEAVRAGIRNVVETTVVDLSVARSIAAGTALILPIQGTAYFIDKGADVGLATIHIQDQAVPPANSISTFPGDANNNLAFTFWVIENIAQAGKVLRIHYGTGIQFLPGLGGNITFTGGVSILQTAAGSPQNGDQDTANNKAWTVSLFSGALAAQVTAVGVSLPATSVVSYIDRVTLNSNVATLISWGDQANNFVPAVGTQPRTKKFPAAAVTTQVNAGNNVGLGQVIGSCNLQANVDRDIIFTRPFELTSAHGLFFVSNVVNLTLTGFAEGREY